MFKRISKKINRMFCKHYYLVVVSKKYSSPHGKERLGVKYKCALCGKIKYRRK